MADRLFLRPVEHSQAREAYRVILKNDDGETELGSIGIRQLTRGETTWFWGIDTVVPMRDFESEGYGADRRDCMKKFRAAWERLASDPARLAEFMRYKRQRD